MRGVPGFFAPRGFHPFALGLHVPSEGASFYHTGGLAKTLAERIDFDDLNDASSMRLGGRNESDLRIAGQFRRSQTPHRRRTHHG